jgi:hypothetical protein
VPGSMIPVGYMAKRVKARPEWLPADRVRDVYSVSACVSRDFADYINFWKHNGYWFFDSPRVILELAQQGSIDLAGTTLFFYEAYERQFVHDRGEWVGFEPERAFPTDVLVPDIRTLEGYDVVTFSAGTSAECSPLSCNALATDVRTNAHCLLDSLERARRLLEDGTFRNAEPGPYRILAVYSTAWPSPAEADVESGAAFCEHGDPGARSHASGKRAGDASAGRQERARPDPGSRR